MLDQVLLGLITESAPENRISKTHRTKHELDITQFSSTQYIQTNLTFTKYHKLYYYSAKGSKIW